MKTTPQRYVPVVEDVARLINETLDRQERVALPFNIFALGILLVR
jgi:hypothetical protein